MTAPVRQGSVLRNTLILVGAHVLVIPLSVVVNAVMARQLGPSDFGYLSLAFSLCGFGYMIAEWGHAGVLPRAIAQDHQRAGALLGSSLASRFLMGTIVSFGLALLSWFLYPVSFLPLLGLAALHSLVATVSAAYQDAARGFERTDVTAVGRIGGQLLNAAFVLPVLLLGGGIIGAMVGGTVAGLLLLPLIVTMTHRIGVGAPTFQRGELAYLTREGWSFLIFSAALTAQGFVDNLTLSKLAPPEALGWNSAALKIVGTLLVPSTALIAALYPTLSRLYVEDVGQFMSTLRRSISGTGLLAIPLALGCALYSDVGIAIYGGAAYAPAVQNLTVLSGMVLLGYFSLPLGSALLAIGRNVAWAAVLLGCVVLRVALNLLLIPWFQKHFGNGGMGVCVASVLCEVALLSAALRMLPSGVMNRTLLLGLGKGLLSGFAMAAVALGLRGISPWIAGPIATMTYLGALYVMGGIDMAQIYRIVDGLRSKLYCRRQVSP